MESKQKVTVYWKDSWYHLKDKDDNFLQLNSVPRVSTVFGSISAAIARSSRVGIEEIAAEFDLQIEQTWAEFWRDLVQRLAFTWWPILLLVGSVLVMHYFTSRVESPSLLLGGVVFITLALIFFGTYFLLQRKNTR